MHAQYGFQLGHTRGKLLILLPRPGRHGFDAVELLARHEIEVGDQALETRLDHGFHLAPEGVGRARRIGEHAGHAIEKAVVSLHYPLPFSPMRPGPAGYKAQSVHNLNARKPVLSLTALHRLRELNAPGANRAMIEAALPFPNIDPVLIHIYGPISIRWYALSYIAGLLLGWWYVSRLLYAR